MIIKDIQFANNGRTRTDGRYPLRIGCEVHFAFPPKKGECLYIVYDADNNGNPKEGALRTSVVTGVSETESEIFVKTMRSVYVFSKVGRQEGMQE